MGPILNDSCECSTWDPRVEMAGIEPASLKDRPDILRAQSMLSLLLGSCTHTDMVQTSPVTEKSRTASVTTAVQQAF